MSAMDGLVAAPEHDQGRASDAVDQRSPQRTTSPRWPMRAHAATKSETSAVLNANIS
jgi:hypothetical protein